MLYAISFVKRAMPEISQLTEHHMMTTGHVYVKVSVSVMVCAAALSIQHTACRGQKRHQGRYRREAITI